MLKDLQTADVRSQCLTDIHPIKLFVYSARLKYIPFLYLSQETEPAESVEAYVNKLSAKNKRLVTLKRSNVDIVLNTSYLITKRLLSLYCSATLQVKDCMWETTLHMLSSSSGVREAREFILSCSSCCT